MLRANEIVAGDLGREVRAEDATATAASVSGDSNAPVGDISTLLNPDSALGEIVTAFDPNAVADITSLMSGDLASNASRHPVTATTILAGRARLRDERSSSRL